MNDYQEYKSYGSYLSRVFAIIIAFALLVLAIWFVVKLASGDNDDSNVGEGTSKVLTIDTDSSGSSDGSNGGLGVNDTVAVSSEGLDRIVEAIDDDASSILGASSDSSDEDGIVSSTSTDDSNVVVGGDSASTTSEASELPNTGASFSLILLLPAIAYFASKSAIVAFDKR